MHFQDSLGSILLSAVVGPSSLIMDPKAQDAREPQSGCSHGQMVAAMCYRTKYRLVDSAHKVIRMLLQVAILGVHPANRGGVYPSGVRCKSLCEDAIDIGFVKEELNHNLVAVEEPPIEEISLLGETYTSASAYNASECIKDELLASCFKSPYQTVQYTLLGHNHMMLVERAFVTQAKWDLQPNATKGITFCDVNGRLSITAVAASPNGKELAESIAEGLPCEILSWKWIKKNPTRQQSSATLLIKGTNWLCAHQSFPQSRS